MKKHILLILALFLSLSLGLIGCGNQLTKTVIIEKINAQTPQILKNNLTNIQVRKGEEVLPLEVKGFVNDMGSLSYQWYVSDTSDMNNIQKVQKANKSILSIDTSKVVKKYYYCEVTNTNMFVSGNQIEKKISDIYCVNVYSFTELPRIVKNSLNKDIVIGKTNEELSVEAKVSNGELSYQWFETDFNSPNYTKAVIVEGANSSVYKILTEILSEKCYFCQITNTIGGDSSIVNSKFIKVKISYDYSNFNFVKIDNDSCKLTAYTGNNSKLNIPNFDSEGRSVTQIDKKVFANAQWLQEITIPDTVTEIGLDAKNDPEGTFYKCTQLKKINFNGQIFKIGNFAFTHCEILEFNDFWTNHCKTLTEIGIGALQDLYEWKGELVIPKTINRIENYSFQRLHGITSLRFEEETQIYYIGNAFGNSNNLHTVTIPASVNQIQNDCFGNLPKLNTIYINITQPLRNISAVFGNSKSNIQNIYVPIESLEAYKLACSELKNKMHAITE